MEKPFTRKRKLHHCCVLLLALLTLAYSPLVQAQCVSNAGNGWGPANNSYWGAALTSCSTSTLYNASYSSTSYNQWDGIAGTNMTFTCSGGFVSGSTVWTYYEYLPGWVVIQSGTGGTANITVNRTSPAGGGWNLIVFYNNSNCPPTWNAGSATLTYKVNSQSSPSISNSGSQTVCGGTTVNYSVSGGCNYPVKLTAGQNSGTVFPTGTTTVTWETYHANGAGGYFTYPAGANNQTIALAACESVYGAGGCTAGGGCGNFTYYYQNGDLSCDCNKAVGKYEFVYNNSGYTQVGQDYGGNSTPVSTFSAGSTSGVGPFTRVKSGASCSGFSWSLAQPDLRQWGGTTTSFNVTEYSTTNNPGTITAPSSICQGSSASITEVTPSTTGSPASSGPFYDYYYQRTSSPATGWVSYQTGNGNTSAPLPTAVTNTPGTYQLARNSYYSCLGEVSAPFLNLTVYGTQTMSLSSGLASPTLCKNTTLGSNTVYTFGGGATSASITAGALPAGMSGSIVGNTFVISGTPSTAGTFTYTVTSSGAGNCSPVSLGGTITVNDVQTMTQTGGSANPSVCKNSALSPNNVYTFGGGATSASISAGALPAGMSGTVVGSTFVISGTPTVAGSFPYTVTSSGAGGCSPVSIAGTITVNNLQTLAITGGTAITAVCKNSAFSPNTVFTFGGGATSASISAGALPAGMSGNIVGSTFVVSGTPTVAGSFPYTVTSSGAGNCTPISVSATIVVNDIQTMTQTGGSASPSVCKNVALSPNNVYTFGGGATSASISAGSLPAGMNGSVVGSTFVISGTPTVTGSFPYTVTSSGTGNCSPVSIAGTITVNNTQTMTSTGGNTSPSFCRATTLGSNIVFTFGGGATSASITAGSLPTGMNGSVVGSTFVISGTPTMSGSYPYTVTSSGAGGCSPVSLGGTITIYQTPTSANVSDIIDGCNGGHTATVLISGGASPYNFTVCGTPYTNQLSPFALDATSNTSCTLTAVTDALGCVPDAITGSPVTYPTRTLTAGDTYACTVSTGATKIFYDNSGNLMAKVTDAGGGPGLGATTVIATVDATLQKYGPVNKQSYLQRHFKISPTNTTSASVCLYMSDAEISMLHDSSATDNHIFPSYYPTVQTNLSNAVVTKFHGGSETPISNTSRQVLTPTSKVHNPIVNGVQYNNVWEVCMNVTSWSGFYLHGQNVNNTALPVTLLYLTADAVNNKYIQLDWATASEINNQGFEIQRSTDGVTFERIAFIDGHGNSNSTIAYSYDDKTVQPGSVYYYRLKQIDIDGQSTLTEIVSASLIGDKGFVFEDLIPNPAVNSVQLGILTTAGQKTTVNITDVLGRVVLSAPWQLAEGYNISTFDISDLADGTYNVTVYSGTTYTTKRLVVTK